MPSGQLAQLLQGSPDLLLGPVDSLARVRSRSRWPAAPEDPRHLVQPPLGSVVQTALQTPALVVARVEDPPPGSLEVGHPGADLALEATVRGRQPGRRRDRVAKPGILQHGRVMHDDGHRLTVVRHVGDGPLRVRAGEREPATIGADERVGLVEPVPDVQGGVAQCLRQCGSQGPGPIRSQLHHEIGHLDPLRVGGEQADQQASRDQAQHRLVGQQRGLAHRARRPA